MPSSAKTDYAAPFRGSRWVGVVARSRACPDLGMWDLLHAGPPFRGAPPAPVREAAIQALLFEGLAGDRAEAENQLGSPARLLPAQNHGVATPLAQVISASMPLLVVEQGAARAYAAVIEGPPPALRFGSAETTCRVRLATLATALTADVLPLLLREPTAIDAVIRIAVAAGDDCHARTGAANEALISSLRGLGAATARVLRANPGFVLAIFMAAGMAALRTHGCAVEAIGGNGIDFGVRYRGHAGWRCVPSEAPRGTRMAGLESQMPLGAIGDSVLIDFCGLGGQALAAAPLLAADWAASLPPDALSRRAALIDPRTGLVDPGRIVAAHAAPLINLAVIGSDAGAGLIGRGCYIPPLSLFQP